MQREIIECDICKKEIKNKDEIAAECYVVPLNFLLNSKYVHVCEKCLVVIMQCMKEEEKSLSN